MKILLIPMTLLFLVSCAGEKMSRLELDYGTSYNLAKEGQTLDPEAAMDLEPVEGLDAEAGQAVLNNYHKSFEPSRQKSGYQFQMTRQ